MLWCSWRSNIDGMCPLGRDVAGPEFDMKRLQDPEPIRTPISSSVTHRERNARSNPTNVVVSST